MTTFGRIQSQASQVRYFQRWAGSFFGLIAAAALAACGSEATANESPWVRDPGQATEAQRPAIVHERRVYRVSESDIRRINIGDQVFLAGRPVGHVVNLHITADDRAYVAVSVNPESYGEARMGIELLETGERAAPAPQVRGVALTNQVSQPRGARASVPPEEEKLSEQVSRAADNAREELSGLAARLSRAVDEVRGQPQEERREEPKAVEETRPDPFVSLWAEETADEVDEQASRLWQRARSAWRATADGLSEQFTNLNRWAEEKQVEENVRQHAADLQERIDHMQERLRHFNRQQAENAERTSRVLMREVESLRRELQYLGESERAQQLNEAAENLRESFSQSLARFREDTKPAEED